MRVHYKRQARTPAVHEGCGASDASWQRVSFLFQRLLLIAALVAWCIALLILRHERWGTMAYTFLIWNLFLAIIPAVVALAVRRRSGPRFTPMQMLFTVLWLVFLPNAPYLVTDFVHLDSRPPVPLWFDIALLTSAAATGLFLAYSSVADVQHAITQAWGRAAGWLVAITSLVLSGLGIFFGRFLRWNSWDVVAKPSELIQRVARSGLDPLQHPRPIGVTVIYGAALILGYVALRGFAFIVRSEWPEE